MHAEHRRRGAEQARSSLSAMPWTCWRGSLSTVITAGCQKITNRFLFRIATGTTSLLKM